MEVTGQRWMPLLPGGDGDLQRAIFQALQAGNLRLLGVWTGSIASSRGLVRSALGNPVCDSPSPRPARPQRLARVVTAGHTLAPLAATRAGHVRGRWSGSGPTTGTQEPGGGGGGADAAAGEQELAFTLMTSLTDEIDLGSSPGGEKGGRVSDVGDKLSIYR